MEDDVAEIMLKLAAVMDSDHPNSKIELTRFRRELIAEALRFRAFALMQQEPDDPERP